MNGPMPTNRPPSPAEKAWMLGAISHAIPLVPTRTPAPDW
jgi:hypothetical protein